MLVFPCTPLLSSMYRLRPDSDLHSSDVLKHFPEFSNIDLVFNEFLISLNTSVLLYVLFFYFLFFIFFYCCYDTKQLVINANFYVETLLLVFVFSVVVNLHTKKPFFSSESAMWKCLLGCSFLARELAKPTKLSKPL